MVAENWLISAQSAIFNPDWEVSQTRLNCNKSFTDLFHQTSLYSQGTDSEAIQKSYVPAKTGSVKHWIVMSILFSHKFVNLWTWVVGKDTNKRMDKQTDREFIISTKKKPVKLSLAVKLSASMPPSSYTTTVFTVVFAGRSSSPILRQFKQTLQFHSIMKWISNQGHWWGALTERHSAVVLYLTAQVLHYWIG